MSQSPDTGSGEAPTADLEHATPAPFDPKASASAIISEARSIQELLGTYEQNTRRLKEDVQEFVIREVAEESKFHSLSVVVAQGELQALQNTEFIKFSHNYGDTSDVPADEVMPTIRMRKSVDGCSASGVVQPSPEVPWATVQHAWTPDCGVSMKAYGDVREVLLGWRSQTAASSQQFAAMCAEVFATKDTRMCCFFNGELYSPPLLGMPEYVAASRDALQNSFWNALAARKSGRSPQSAVDVAVHSYTAFATAASSLVASEVEQYLWNASESTCAAVTAADGTANSFAPQIIGDAQDCLVAVKPHRLHQTQTFRGFFVEGSLAAIEHTGPQVDVLRLLCTLNDAEDDNISTSLPSNFAEQEEQRIIATFRHLFAVFGACNPAFERSAVVTLAIAPEALPSAEQTVSAAATPHSSGVLLCIRPITPSLPFLWHLTWAQICAMGQMLGNARRGGRGAGRDDERSVVFKCTRLTVAALAPTNTLSSIYFPILNEQIAVALSGGARPATPATETSNETRKDSRDPCLEERRDPNHTTARIAGVVAVVSTAAAAAAAVLLSRK